MQSMRHLPDHLESNEATEHEHDEMLHEARRREIAQKQSESRSDGNHRDLVPRRLRERGKLLFALFFRRQFFVFFCGCFLRDRRSFRRGRRKGHGTSMRSRCAANDVVLHVLDDCTVLAGGKIG